MIRLVRAIGALAVVVGAVSTGEANLILDGGFETPGLANGMTKTYTTGQMIGAWRVVGPSVVQVEKTYSEIPNGITAFSAQEGSYSLDLTGPGNTGFSSGVQQIVRTVAGQLYDISFAVGRAAGTNAYYAAPAVVDLSIGGGVRLSFENSDLTPGTVNWQQFTTRFRALGSSTVLTFFNGTASPTAMAGLDNVRLLQVPEPAALVLFGVGGVALVFAARRYRRV